MEDKHIIVEWCILKTKQRMKEEFDEYRRINRMIGRLQIILAITSITFGYSIYNLIKLLWGI